MLCYVKLVTFILTFSTLQKDFFFWNIVDNWDNKRLQLYRIHLKDQRAMTRQIQWHRACSYGQNLVNHAQRELFQLEEPRKRIFWEQVLLGDMEENQQDMWEGTLQAVDMRLESYRKNLFTHKRREKKTTRVNENGNYIPKICPGK